MVWILQNLIVPKSHNAKAARHEILVSLLIPQAIDVLAAIGFDDKLMLE